MSANSPVLYRPIPRRPFVTNPATPPSDGRKDQGYTAGDKRPASDASTSTSVPSIPLLARDAARFAESRPRYYGQADAPDSGASNTDTLSRVQSIRNLTSSTLFGIFSDSRTDGSQSGRSGLGSPSTGLFEPSTPWGTGAETPARELFSDDANNADNDDDDDDDYDDDDNDDNDEGNDHRITADKLDEVRRASMSLLMLQRKRRRGESFGADGVSGTRLPPVLSSRRYGSGNAAGAASSVKTFAAGAETAAAAAAAGAGAGTTALDDECQTILAPPVSRTMVALTVIARAGLLFVLGMGYGAMVSRLRSETSAVAAAAVLDDFASPLPDMASSPAPAPAPAPAPVHAAYDATRDWRYLVSWGVSGVVLGTLLPWFDAVWDRTWGGRSSKMARAAPETDWALMVRGIGAFAGVVFAIRKLPWASTMQASLTLALANPFLWYLLDRSKSGLLLAAAVGFVGSAALIACNLDLMPSTDSGHHLPQQQHQQQHDGSLASVNGSSTLADAAMAGSSGLGLGLGSTANVETAIWMLSVLFCSCVCFGNIGRRLALPAAARRR